MGISRMELRFLESVARLNIIHSKSKVLELGDFEIVEIPDLVDTVAALMKATGHWDEDLIRKAQLVTNANSMYQRRFGGAKVLYEVLFGFDEPTVVDVAPGPRTILTDLNYPATLGRIFDVVINNGTSEHIFNQANVFKFIHDHTKIDGVMLHWTPSIGCVDHGFFNIQPNLFLDLATANQYEIAFLGLCTPDDVQQLRS